MSKLADVADPARLAVQVRDLVRDAQDVLLVYYVGHGIRTSEGQLALALKGTDPDAEVLAYTGMLYENLAKILRGCRARTKLVILDCCHAELGHRANYIFQSANLTDAYPVDGLYFIGASARDKKAKAPLGGELTYFTQEFLAVVRSGIPIPSPTLRMDQIFVALRARLTSAGLPEPVEAGTRGAYQFPFALNVAALESEEVRERPFRKHRHTLVRRGAVLAVVVASLTAVTVHSLSELGGANGTWSIDAGALYGGQDAYVGTWTSADLVAVGFDDSITAYSLNSGHVLWTWTPPSGQELCEMSSTVDDGIGMIAYYSDERAASAGGYHICQAMTALNLMTGTASWAAAVSLAPGRGPNSGSGEGIVLDRGVAAALEGDDNIYGYSLATGRQLWSSASTWPQGDVVACGGEQTNFNYSNIAESESTAYVDYACTADGVNYKSYVLGVRMDTGAPAMNLTLTGVCKAGASGLWAYPDYLIADCGNESAKPVDDLDVITAASAQLSETLPTDSVDTLQSLENQTGQIESHEFTVSGSTLYAEGSSAEGGNIALAVDLDTGATLWSKPVPSNLQLSFIGSSSSGAIAALFGATPSTNGQINILTYAEADGAQSDSSSLTGSSVTVSSDNAFLEDDGYLIDVDGSATGSTPFISVYSGTHMG